MAQSTMSTGNLKSLLLLADSKGMTEARFTQILASGLLADLFDANAILTDRPAVRIALKLGVVLSEVFRFKVDYSMTLKQMYNECCGEVGYLRGQLPHSMEGFSVVGEGVLEFEARYFCFNRNISSEDAASRIEEEDKANPWQPAKIEHLLAFGTAYPEGWREHAIPALGSVAKPSHFRVVPLLGFSHSYEGVDYASVHDRMMAHAWGPSQRFLAVRPIKL